MVYPESYHVLPNVLAFAVVNPRWNTRRVSCALTTIACLLACDRAPQSHDQAWREMPARFDAADGIAVLIAYDMEGASGIDEWRMFDANFPEYLRGREIMTDDVNAVIDGLFAGGATRVDVVDMHGSGSNAPDVVVEKLDPRARHVFKDESFWEFDLVVADTFDAVVVVGMHCKSGSGGFAPHTCGLGMEMKINGRTITEAEWMALLWGEVGVPLILVSGDDRTRSDLSTLGWIEFVEVKKATSATTAVSLAPDSARASLRAGAARAVAKLAQSRAIVAASPVKIGIHANPPASLDALVDLPGIDYRDQWASFESPALVEAGPAINAILNIANESLATIAYERLDSLMGLEPSLRAYWTKTNERWLGYESGTWKPAVADSNETPRVYHGVD